MKLHWRDPHPTPLAVREITVTRIWSVMATLVVLLLLAVVVLA